MTSVTAWLSQLQGWGQLWDQGQLKRWAPQKPPLGSQALQSVPLLMHPQEAAGQRLNPKAELCPPCRQAKLLLQLLEPS